MPVQTILDVLKEDRVRVVYLPVQTQSQPELQRNQIKNAHRRPDPLGLSPRQEQDQAPDRRPDREVSRSAIAQVQDLSPTLSVADVTLNLLEAEMWG